MCREDKVNDDGKTGGERNETMFTARQQEVVCQVPSLQGTILDACRSRMRIIKLNLSIPLDPSLRLLSGLGVFLAFPGYVQLRLLITPVSLVHGEAWH